MKKLIILMVACLFLYGCAAISIDPQSGKLTAYGLAKDIDANGISYTKDPNTGYVHWSAQSVKSHTASFADSITTMFIAITAYIVGG